MGPLAFSSLAGNKFHYAKGYQLPYKILFMDGNWLKTMTNERIHDIHERRQAGKWCWLFLNYLGINA